MDLAMDLEIPALGLLAAGIWLWWESLQAREVALEAARAACWQLGLTLLDEVVSLSAVHLVRTARGSGIAGGGTAVERRYAFEFSLDPNDRTPGIVTLLGRRVLMVRLEYPDGAIVCSAEDLGLAGGCRRASPYFPPPPSPPRAPSPPSGPATSPPPGGGDTPPVAGAAGGNVILFPRRPSRPRP